MNLAVRSIPDRHTGYRRQGALGLFDARAQESSIAFDGEARHPLFVARIKLRLKISGGEYHLNALRVLGRQQYEAVRVGVEVSLAEFVLLRCIEDEPVWMITAKWHRDIEQRRMERQDNARAGTAALERRRREFRSIQVEHEVLVKIRRLRILCAEVGQPLLHGIAEQFASILVALTLLPRPGRSSTTAVTARSRFSSNHSNFFCSDW